MPRIVLIAVLTLAACSNSEAGDSIAANAPDPSGWRLTSGKTPTQAEFAALAASCQERSGSLDSCLADLGLKRAK
jgi:hypothetical protein